MPTYYPVRNRHCGTGLVAPFLVLASAMMVVADFLQEANNLIIEALHHDQAATVPPFCGVLKRIDGIMSMIERCARSRFVMWFSTIS